MARFLITGGAGFIGAHVARVLGEQGHEIRILDDFSNSDAAVLETLPPHTFVQGDIRDVAALDACMQDVDHVIHLAARVSVVDSVADPSGTWDVNVTGSLRVLEAARAAGVRSVVFASSSAVYGAAPAPLAEDAPCWPLSPYGAQKYAVEAMCSTYFYSFGLPVTPLRFFNVYGPGQRAGGPYAAVITQFVGRSRTDDPLRIFGDGSQTRDFVHVDDVARSLVAAATREDPHPYEPINIGTGQALTIATLAATIRDVCASSSTLVFEDPRDGEILHSVAVIERAKTKLNFAPIYTLETGLRTLV